MNNSLSSPADIAPAAFAFRSFQREDLARAAIYDGCILAWDKGLGKGLATFAWPILKGASYTLIVAPGSLHQQIVDEGREKFKTAVRLLDSQEAFQADPLLRAAALARRNNQPLPALAQPAFWLTTYQALGYNDADQWEPKEDAVTGEKIVSQKLLLRRHADPRFTKGADAAIGVIKNGVRCLYRPSLAVLVADLFEAVVCDEAVRLKSTDSYVSMGVRELRPRYRLVTTATPVKNRLEDIFWLAHWACGGHHEATARWPYANSREAKETFADTHMMIERNETKEEQHLQRTGTFRRFEKRTAHICNIHRLWKLLGPVVIRRRKDNIGADVVPKTIVPIRVHPGSAQQAVYKFHATHAPAFTRDGNPMNPIASTVAQIQNLRQAALCPDSLNLGTSGYALYELKQELKLAMPAPDAAATEKARKVAAKGARTPFENEAHVAFGIVEKMAETGKLDIEKILEAAPHLRPRLEAALERATVKLCADTKSAKPTARSWTDHNPKQAAILKLVADIIESGQQLIVMSPFQHFGISLERRLVESGVSVCRLDGSVPPAKRGRIAKQFKQGKFAVMVAGIESMGEGHSFENCAHLVLPSLHWAFDVNDQAIDRIHRLTSKKPVAIYTLITTNTIDERLAQVFQEKGDSARLALDGCITNERIEEINLAELLRDAIRNFDPKAETIPETDIEKEWESLKLRLHAAQARFSEWHPPIVPDATGETVTARQVRKACRDAGVKPAVTLAERIPDATYAAITGINHPELLAKLKTEFAAFCAAGDYTDWRMAWRAFDLHRQKQTQTKLTTARATLARL